MSSVSQRLQAVRSLATGALISRRRSRDVRLLPLTVPDPASNVTVDTQASVADLQQLMSTGHLTSVDITSAFLRQIPQREPHLHSLVSVNPNVLQDAQKADARRAAGETGALLGVPITIKDNIETAGAMPTTGGAEILLDHLASRDAALVTGLREAGAIILGKANLSELAGAVVHHPGFSAVGGQTMNPHGDDFSPAGSSSGSAAGVAAGLTPLSVGTETSGSLMAPGALCAVVAMKPSRDLVDGTGVIPLVRHQDSAGPVARTVADAAALLEVLSGGAVVAETVSLEGLRMGLLAEDIEHQEKGLEDTSDAPDLRARIEARLRGANAQVVIAEMVSDIPADQLENALLPVVFGGLAFDTVDYLHGVGAPIATLAELQAYNLSKPRRRMPAGQALLSTAVLRGISRQAYDTAALDLRASMAKVLDDTFTAADSDVLVSVSNIHSAFYATAGYPAITIPAGLRRSGTPTGITLIGRSGSDSWLLGVAEALEAAH